MNQEIIKKLQAPFQFAEVETKIQVTSADKNSGLCVFYLDSRAVQKRLDETLGPNNWKNRYYAWQDKAQLCGISIYDEERNEWIEKQDGAENSDIEAVKGGLTDSFKRAAVVWGVGRYMYEIGCVWVDIEIKGKSTVIKHDQYKKIESAYNKALARISSGVAPTVPQTNATTDEAASQAPSDKTKATRDEYKVKSVKPSGKSSQLLELVDSGGEVVSAYIKNTDKTVVAGSRLQRVQMERKTSSYGDYNLINAYQLAA